MEISFGKKMDFDMNVAGGAQASRSAAVSGKADALRTAANLTVTGSVAGIDRTEPAADIPDAALARDDALGRLVDSAFDLPPPPMPVFA